GRRGQRAAWSARRRGGVCCNSSSRQKGSKREDHAPVPFALFLRERRLRVDQQGSPSNFRRHDDLTYVRPIGRKGLRVRHFGRNNFEDSVIGSFRSVSACLQFLKAARFSREPRRVDAIRVALNNQDRRLVGASQDRQQRAYDRQIEFILELGRALRQSRGKVGLA